MGIRTHKRVKEYVAIWEERCYPGGLPDEAPVELKDKVPSYKRICLALLNNDLQLTSLGYSPKKTIYYSLLKKIEFQQKGKVFKTKYKATNQLELL